MRPFPALGGIQHDFTVSASPVEGYRTRLKWVCGPNGALGLYAQKSHAVVDTPQCMVATPMLLRVGEAVRSILRDPRHVSFAADLSAVDMRQVDGEIVSSIVTFLLRSEHTVGQSDLARAANDLARLEPAASSIGWSVRTAGSPQLLGQGGATLEGAARLVDRVGSVEIFATPGSFVQAHRGQARFLESELTSGARALASELGRPPRVLELYAGSGAFGLALAKGGSEVVSVESFAPAARSIGEAAARIGVTVAWHAADAETYVRERQRDATPFDLVLVDPPRRGLPSSLRRALADLAPRSMVYVSCSPVTLARDLADLARLGFSAERLTPVDMFPHTDHVEAIAWLRMTEPRPALEVFRDADLIAFDKAPHESVADLWQRAGRAHPDLSPLTSLPAEVSGPVLFARRASEAPDLRHQLGQTVRLTVNALLKGISPPKAPGRGAGASPRFRYIRKQVVSGHSEVRLDVQGELEACLAKLADGGHPVIGASSRGDEPTRRHFFEKHGLDRAYCWVTRLSFERTGRRTEIVSTEPPDLASVRKSLEG